VLTSTPFGRRPLPRMVFDKTVEWLSEPRGALRSAMPMLAGGVTEAMIEPLVRAAGSDVILGVGGAIQGHPQGAEAGARTIRAAIDEALSASVPT